MKRIEQQTFNVFRTTLLLGITAMKEIIIPTDKRAVELIITVGTPRMVTTSEAAMEIILTAASPLLKTLFQIITTTLTHTTHIPLELLLLLLGKGDTMSVVN